ncbi:type II toxin-antitoxin system VapC family toxin [Haladaptatus pallidirubidus]|uniref:Type II toxin-antitoxin system VapC family toxin n=1 Tax=Haladaptatus pallidirubidus TaxID=1008152 RepID=A0AAV3UPB8_9EURY|nr:PIN domain-containing protein [Haladaptatus pallidirubidus]
MSEQPQPLFIDTGAFFAWVNTRAGRHETAQSVFDALRCEAIPYQPLFTSRYVLSELVTLTSRKVNHKITADALQTIRRSESFNILPVGEGVFAAACDEFERYDDQQISFIDHTSTVLAHEYDIEHIFTFDRGFTTLGLTCGPADIHFSE